MIKGNSSSKHCREGNARRARRDAARDKKQQQLKSRHKSRRARVSRICNYFTTSAEKNLLHYTMQ
jgi:hypothetical protein